jgi:hypothetical protein
MTHDELLAKMDYEVKAAEFEDACGDGNDPRVARALRAVVELHKPRVYGQTQLRCSICLWTDYYDTEPDMYPCPTIQAIEKELS